MSKRFYCNNFLLTFVLDKTDDTIAKPLTSTTTYNIETGPTIIYFKSYD